jgi:putative acetyltransferase
MMRIVPGDLGDPRVIDLLQIHLKRARAETAPGSAHALDLAGSFGRFGTMRCCSASER